MSTVFDILSFLEIHFDRVVPVSSKSGQYKVSPCPNCGNNKKKLYVNIESGVFHCFVCDYGRGAKIDTLIKDVGDNPADYVIEGEYQPSKQDVKPVQPISEHRLPIEFRNLIGNSAVKAKQALDYLRNRGISDSIISEYGIGYCFEGEYNNRIIIPYYENNELLFFTGRDFTDTQTPKYLNPSWDKINFLFNYERVRKSSLDFIVVVEGVMDVFSMPNHSVCLQGKFASVKQKEILKRYKKIYVALDSDATSEGISLCDDLSKDFRGSLYLLKLPPGEDPSSLGVKMYELLKTAEKYNVEDPSIVDTLLSLIADKVSNSTYSK